MASRLNLSRYVDVGEVAASVEEDSAADPATYGARPVVTPAIVDEAVDNVLRTLDYPPEVKETFRKLLASDPSTGFAGNLYMSKSEGREYNAFPRIQRRVVKVTRVLTSSETADIVKYVPEFDVKFSDEEAHDHAVAAVMRDMDFELLVSMFPRGCASKDIGGNPLYHIRNGNMGSHVCGPLVDPKDPSRAANRLMRAKRIVESPAWPDDSRELARRYVAGDTGFVCNKLGQECDFQSKVTVSSHVYDIPVQDLPKIMDRAGAFMHLGNVLFPFRAYQESVGELAIARARYEIDVERNRFRMGFVGSAAWWYDHNWLDFMRYGADQVILYGGNRYCYKITERRGDTIFFKVLRVNGLVGSIEKQWYKLPGVPMVKVQGFDYTAGKLHRSVVGSSSLRKCTYWFPQALWEDMLQHAKMEFERGVMTYDKLYNYYRTVVPRKTINGVLVAGGQRVKMNEIVALVTHVGLCAAADVMLGQRTSRQQTARVMERRAWYDNGVTVRAFTLFWTSVKAAAGLLMYGPLMWLCDKITNAVDGRLTDSLVQWAQEPEVREVPFSTLVGDYVRASVSWEEFDTRIETGFLDAYQGSVVADHIRAIKDAPALAALLLEVCPEALSKEDQSELKDACNTADTTGDTTVVGFGTVASSVVAMRKAAIQEAIDESVLEERKLVEVCDSVYRSCTDGRGEPMEEIMRSRAEEYYQPDFWWVENGVIQTSRFGLNALECKYSALFTLRIDPVTGSRFRTVREEYYDGPGEEAEYRVISDTSYTGWAMSMDRLVIFNGPGIRETMEKALLVDHRYTVVVHQAPPGAGKTYQILNSYKDKEVVMCPVRESALDTRAKLMDKRPRPTDLRYRVVTVDSYLNNYEREQVRLLRSKHLHADECYMTPAGRWYAAAGLLGVDRVDAHGDIKQIPHIQRVQAQGLYVRISADVVDERFDTYRCPADAVAAWNHLYDYKVRTHSHVRRSFSRAEDFTGLAFSTGGVLLCMYQADKKELRRLYSVRIKEQKLKVMTVHESEGKTFEIVYLFRFDTRPRSDNMCLFDRPEHCLVAMSRHTKEFKYVRPRNVGDLVDKWMDNSVDPRSITAAAEVASVGITKRYA